MHVEWKLSGRAPTVWCNGVKSDMRMRAPTPVWVAEAQMVRKGKPEAASQAAEGPVHVHVQYRNTDTTKNEAELILRCTRAGGVRKVHGRETIDIARLPVWCSFM